MRKNPIIVCLSILAVSGALLSSCDKETTETVYAPPLTVSSASVTVSNDGGSYSFTYTVGNPADDGTVSCEADADWISDLDWSASGSVSFSADANVGEDPRTAHIALTYSSAYGSASQTVTVAQNSGDTPELTVQPTAVTAAIEGGTYSFTYSVTNPASDGEISCVCDADWVSDLDCSVSGSVSFSVDANPDTSLREAVISVYYTYAGGELSRSETVAVVQNHEGGVGIGSVADLVGTYSCAGIVYNTDWDGTEATEPGIEDTWTMKIYDSGSGSMIISGLMPGYVDYYPEYAYYVASAVLSGNDILVYPHFTGYYNSTGYIWYALASYYSNETATSNFPAGWYVSSGTGIPCTFKYNSATESWTSDYGLVLGLSAARAAINIRSVFNVFAPGMTFYKTSDSTEDSTSTSSVKDPESVPVYHNVIRVNEHELTE